MNSCPLTSSRLKSMSNSAAYGRVSDRKRIQTEVSTKTIMRPSAKRHAHADAEFPAHAFRIREAPEDAHMRGDGPAPRDRGERYPYRS